MKKKYAVLFIRRNETLKRSLSWSQVEVLHIICSSVRITQNKRKYCDITFALPDDEFKKAVLIKKIPLWLAARIEPEHLWIKLK